jgi:twitching motility protein PilI
MNETMAHELISQELKVESEWMLPSAALERFEPPAGMVVAAATAEKRGRYGFQVGTLNLLIKQGSASEVLQMTDIWSLPGSAPWILGLVNLRSNLVPIFDLRRLFGLPQRAANAVPQILVFEQGDRAAGILIDDYPKPIFDMNHLPSMPQLPAELQAHVRGGYVQDETMWLEFDHESFFEELARSAG